MPHRYSNLRSVAAPYVNSTGVTLSAPIDMGELRTVRVIASQKRTRSTKFMFMAECTGVEGMLFHLVSGIEIFDEFGATIRDLGLFDDVAAWSPKT